MGSTGDAGSGPSGGAGTGPGRWVAIAVLVVLIVTAALVVG